MPTTHDQLRGGIYGLLVGDALGVPYEFHPPGEIPPLAAIEMTPPDNFRRAHAGVHPCTWSDDGAQALCLLASLLERNRLDADDLGRRIVAWYDAGYMAVGGHVFDVGITTGVAIRAMKNGTPGNKAGPTGADANGNGSLMRVLPLALWHLGDDEALVADAHVQSLVTHGHPRSQACCALYCLWARQTLRGDDDAWTHAVASLRAIYQKHPAHLQELEFSIRPEVATGGTGSGYVVDCLRSALWATRQGGFETAVKAAISLGRDTDTTACVAGGIAGLRDGVETIPARWLDRLRGRELVDPVVTRLCSIR